jgi:hypothetical protein
VEIDLSFEGTIISISVEERRHTAYDPFLPQSGNPLIFKPQHEHQWGE